VKQVLHGVLFDMDGVLVDSGAAHHESWRVLARRHGRDISDTEFRAAFGGPEFGAGLPCRRKNAVGHAGR
jgi:beta-phosphoglucomutase-like phosphatase (HAD superfamily)